MTISEDKTYTYEGPAGLVILPNEISSKIDEKLDALIAEQPDAAPCREYLRQELVNFFSEYGYVPDCALQKKG